MSDSGFCARCGRPLAAEAQFCSSCGTPRGGGPGASRVLPSNARLFELFENSQDQTGNAWIDFLMFRRMMIPILIRILFVGALIVCAIGCLTSVVTLNWGSALAFLIVGPLVARIYGELVILLFVMNDTLAEMRRTMLEVRDIERTRAV
ncbi:MAG: zinc-ribbon domain-containing protein [Chloroflexi bacterium]|nr:zinc-ribbon domain-containing protein [Chloroflexota bacterium]